MKLFIDSAIIDEIKEAASWGVIEGVTTNPSLLKKAGLDPDEAITEICNIVNGPVSYEATAQVADEIVKQAERISQIHPNINVKIAMDKEGIKAISRLSKKGIKTNATLIFSINQGILAVNAGATFVSPFIGRLDDIGHDGMEVVDGLVEYIEKYGFDTEVIAASIRHPAHVIDAMRCGAHIATIPYKVLVQMFKHPLTDIGIERFLNDWRTLK